MTQNPPPPQRPPSSAAGATTVCGHCCSDDRWILHNVRLRGLYRKLCTSCVLKLHPTSFCPTCFSLHDPISPPPPPTSITNTKSLTCFKCCSLSHSTCVPPNAPKSPYLCPACTNPSHKFFDIRKPKRDCSDSSPPKEQLIDEREARVFLAAARIAAISMNKAVGLAKVDVERKVKESVVAKKRAKEAIDHVMVLSSRFAIRGSGYNRPAPNPSPSMNPNPVSAGPNVVPVKVDKNGVVTGRASNGTPPPAVVPPEIKNVGRPSTDGPVSGAVVGQLGVQSNGTTTTTTTTTMGSSDKNHEGSGKDSTGP